jgi:hypothetical protein
MCMQSTSWYYVQNEESKGPVEQSEFANLVSEGTIGAGTLVWQEGMADWQPYAEMAAPAQATVPTAAPLRVALGLASVACSRCGQTFRADEVFHIGGVAVCANCRPLALQGPQAGVVHQDTKGEQLRKAHLCREAYVKSVGTLYYAAGALFVLGGLGLAFVPPQAAARRAGPLLWLVVVGFAAFLIATGAGLRQLRPWSRIASGILAGIGLVSNFPAGTLINGCILYLLFSKKGSMVFSEPYQRVIAATPHLKYRTPLYVWILLGIFLLFVAGVFVAVLSGRHGK